MRKISLKTGEFVILGPSESIRYTYAYIIPERIDKKNTVKIKLVFHSSTRIDKETKTYVSIYLKIFHGTGHALPHDVVFREMATFFDMINIE